MVLSNVWQWCCPTFDNNIVKALEKSEKLKPPAFTSICMMAQGFPIENSWRSACRSGVRSVVDALGIDHTISY